MARVVLDGVSKTYPGGVVAVRDVNLDFPDREFVVLVGPSGCGKSTCLRMIAGLETITEGTITIGERVVNDLPPKDRDIAMVFQNYALYPHMTVRNNLAFGLKLRNYPKDKIDARVEEAAEILEISRLLDRKPKALSGGQRQRVALGRAIVRKPQVFLFDEPLSNLDAKLRVQMRTEISKLHQRLRTTMVYVTHDQVEAMTMGDRIVVLKDGVVHQVDNPISLYLHPTDRFVAGFIGSPPMNFFEGDLSGEGEELIFSAPGISLPVAAEHRSPLKQSGGRRAVFGIRPEDICLAEAEAPARECPELEASIEVIEPMGSEVYLYFTAGESSFIGRIPPREGLSVGDRVKVRFRMDKAHFFDPDNDKTIV